MTKVLNMHAFPTSLPPFAVCNLTNNCTKGCVFQLGVLLRQTVWIDLKRCGCNHFPETKLLIRRPWHRFAGKLTAQDPCVLRLMDTSYAPELLGSVQVCDRCFCCGTSVFSQFVCNSAFLQRKTINRQQSLYADSRVLILKEPTSHSFSAFCSLLCLKVPGVVSLMALNSFPLPIHTVILSPSLLLGSLLFVF